MSMYKAYHHALYGAREEELIGAFRPMWNDLLHKDQESCGRYADEIEEAMPLPRSFNERNVEENGSEMGNH